MGNFLTTGSRVSEYREEADLIVSSSSEENMESVNDSGPDEDYVMSEASSSSLLNTNQDHSRDEFHVGDFVWVQGVVDRHQWWPGKIYDSSEASDLALKQMRKGTLLVAFCREETFAWCTPSQLRPFIENFRDFSKTSESTTFLSAVREAVTEIGQHVENLLVCDESLVSNEAVNCGVKEGVLVPDVRRETVTSLLLEKLGIVLEDVKSLAKEGSFGDLLEVEVLKRKISAFNRSNGRFGLAKYDDENPYIIGLEDKEDEHAFKKSPLRKCSKLASKKRKHEVPKIENADLKQVEDSRKRNKKEELGIDIVVDLSTPLASLCKRVKADDVSSSAERNNGSGETIVVQRGKRERKKSKYLSPEYMTDFSRRKSKTESESAERMIKHSAENTGATTEEILDLIRAAALSTQYSQECKSSYDMIREFVSIYRSFTYDYGANHKRDVSDEDKVDKRETPENGNEKKGVTTELEWLRQKLEEMRALLDETEGGEVTEELKMRLEEESSNLLYKVRKMTVGSSS